MAQDTYTGWYTPSYAESTIPGLIRPKGASILSGSYGSHIGNQQVFYGTPVLYIGDQLKDVWSRYYRVNTVQFENVGDSFSHRVCDLSDLTLSQAFAGTSGTWHTDSDALVTDPRYRTKVWLVTYLVAASLKKNDGATNASYIYQFDNPPYHLYPVFASKAVDLIISLGSPDSKPHPDYLQVPYAFSEKATITLYAIDKSDITATRLIEAAEQEIRHIATDHPRGSIRSTDTAKPVAIPLGNELSLWSCQMTLNYKRANDEYVPTTPTFSYGIAFTYEGDRTTGGAEGTWTLTQGAGSTATQAVNSENNLVINCTVHGADSSTVHGTNLSLSTTTYPRIRFRYKTTGSATAKIIVTFSDASTQTVLSETASSTFTVADVALTAAKTVNTITLYRCDDIGSVVYDFFQIYTGNYILPNVTEMEPPTQNKDAEIEIPGMSGNLTQALGTGLMEVSMMCDTDMEHSDLTWRLPQTTTPKSSSYPNNIDLLMETLHRGGFYEDWVWLDLGSPAMQFKARLARVEPSFAGDLGKVRLTWREYRHGSASGETYQERYGTAL